MHTISGDNDKSVNIMDICGHPDGVCVQIYLFTDIDWRSLMRCDIQWLIGRRGAFVVEQSLWSCRQIDMLMIATTYDILSINIAYPQKKNSKHYTYEFEHDIVSCRATLCPK